jgi:uncharacterized protein with GYD domain
MPKYLLQVNYTLDGIRGVQKEGGVRRRAAAEALIKSLGGTMDAFYYAFGDTDVYVIADMPDQASMAAAAIAVSAAGGATVKTTVLLAPEEIDAAGKKSPSYRPPGQ